MVIDPYAKLGERLRSKGRAQGRREDEFDALIRAASQEMGAAAEAALGILVDIALKALSPAINDPTTAVLAIDQVHRLLKAVGKRHLQREELRDERGQVRVIYRTPNWEDYVNVACNEIRTYGATNVQVARRLRAMLDNVSGALPLRRRAALERERGLLDRTLEAHYAYPEDLALARVPDTQGLGGSSPTRIAGRI